MFEEILVVFYLFIDDKEHHQGMGQWDHPERQTPDSYTPPLNKHQINREMHLLGVEPETSEFTLSLGTLPYHLDTLYECPSQP